MAPPKTDVADIQLQPTTHLSTSRRWKAESAWLADLQWMVYPHKWSPVRCRSNAGQGKFAGQRPTFYHCATQPTNHCSLICRLWNLLSHSLGGSTWRRAWAYRIESDILVSFTLVFFGFCKNSNYCLTHASPMFVNTNLQGAIRFQLTVFIHFSLQIGH